MTNMIQNAKDQAAALAMAAYKAAAADGTLPEAEVKTAPVEIPKDTANGDYTTTFCLAASKAMRKNPREVANILTQHMKLDGTVLEGGLQPSSEWRMHAAVYKAYGETNAVFHTHSPYATAFAVVRKSIPAVLIESCIFLGGDIRCADYAAPGTEAVGTNAIPALRDRGGCTLANHGVLAVGKDLAQAYLRAEYIEDVATVSYTHLTLPTNSLV